MLVTHFILVEIILLYSLFKTSGLCVQTAMSKRSVPTDPDAAAKLWKEKKQCIEKELIEHIEQLSATLVKINQLSASTEFEHVEDFCKFRKDLNEANMRIAASVAASVSDAAAGGAAAGGPAVDEAAADGSAFENPIGVDDTASDSD